MTIEEFTEQLHFARSAMKRTDLPDSIRVLVKAFGRTVCLNVKEVGFDKDGMLYIEASE